MRKLALIAAIAAFGTTDAAAARLGDYVLGRFALGANDLDQASARLGQALASDPTSALLRRRAFDFAVIAGDEAGARRLVPAVRADDPANAQVALLDLAGALERGRWDSADAAAARLGAGGFGSVVAPVVRAWIMVGRKRHDDALALIAPELGDGSARGYVLEHRARILAAAGRWPEAAAAWARLVADAGEASGVAARLEAARAAAEAGDRAAALALVAGRGESGALARAHRRLERGESLDLPVDGPREGVAALLTRLAVDLARQRGASAGVPLARIATFLAPRAPEPRIAAAEMLERTGQPIAAAKMIDAIDPKSLYAIDAIGGRAALLDASGDAAGARLLLEAAAARRDAGVAEWLRLGEFHRAADRFDDAAQAYTRALALSPTDAPRAWTLYFLRGGAHEQGGQWTSAEADLRRAAELAPSEPIVLNYLGYALLDRGEKLDEAERLIRRAVELAPDNAAIIDSLGWLYYRTGRYPDAVAALERAVAGAPGDPTMNEHLGDAYWQVGRRIEARFRWRAALASEPEAKARPAIEAKLNYGLDRARLAGVTPPR